MKKKLLIVCTALMLALGLTACGKASTLEEFYSQPKYQSAIEEQYESMRSSYADTYSDMDYKIEGNTFTYTYTFAEQIDDSNLSAMQKNIGDSLSSSVGSTIDGIEEESGITGISVQYIYYNNDGTEIFNETYTE